MVGLIGILKYNIQSRRLSWLQFTIAAPENDLWL